MRLIVLFKETNNFDEINNFFMNNYWNKNRELREAHEKSLNEMEELKRFSRVYIRYIFKEKIGRRSIHYP